VHYTGNIFNTYFHQIFVFRLLNCIRMCMQVWFQNRRAKEKRLKKDAGRQRWSPYFRPMRPDRPQNDSDDRNSLDDQTNVQLDSFGSKSPEIYRVFQKIKCLEVVTCTVKVFPKIAGKCQLICKMSVPCGKSGSVAESIDGVGILNGS